MLDAILSPVPSSLESKISSTSSSSASSCFPLDSESPRAQTEITPPHSPSLSNSLVDSGLHPFHVTEQVSVPNLSEKTPRQPSFGLDFPEDAGYETDREGYNKVARLTPVKIRKRATSAQLRSHRIDVTAFNHSPRVIPIPCSKSAKDLAKRPTYIDLPDVPPLAINHITKAAVGLGLGLPSNHALRTPRATTMPEMLYSSHEEIPPPPSVLLPSMPFPELSPRSVERQKLRLRPTTLPDSPCPIGDLPPRMVYYKHETQLPTKPVRMATSCDFDYPGTGKLAAAPYDVNMTSDSLCNTSSVMADQETDRRIRTSFNPYFPQI